MQPCCKYFFDQFIFFKCCNVFLQASRHSRLKDEIYWCPETVSICTVCYFLKIDQGKKKTPLIQKLQNIMPQTDIFKIVLLLQDLKIAVSLINEAAFDLMCNLLTNWHPSDIFIELLLIYWVSLHLKQLSPLYVDFCWTGLTRFLPHCTLITWRHAKQNQQGSWKVIGLI